MSVNAAKQVPGMSGRGKRCYHVHYSFRANIV